MKENESKKTERANMLHETEQKFIDQVTKEVYQTVPVKETTFAESASALTSAAFNYYFAPSKELTNINKNEYEDNLDSMESNDLIIGYRVENELAEVLQDANETFTDNIKETFNHAEKKNSNITKQETLFREYLQRLIKRAVICFQ